MIIFGQIIEPLVQVGWGLLIAGQVKWSFCPEGSDAEAKAHHFLGSVIQVRPSELKLVNPTGCKGHPQGTMSRIWTLRGSAESNRCPFLKELVRMILRLIRLLPGFLPVVSDRETLGKTHNGLGCNFQFGLECPQDTLVEGSLCCFTLAEYHEVRLTDDDFT